jgi:hypothetical protein
MTEIIYLEQGYKANTFDGHFQNHIRHDNDSSLRRYSLQTLAVFFLSILIFPDQWRIHSLFLYISSSKWKFRRFAIYCRLKWIQYKEKGISSCLLKNLNVASEKSYKNNMH